MPYELRGNCVYKKDGTKIKCHPDHKSALAHLAALKINVEHVERKEYDELEVLSDMSQWGLTSEQALEAGTVRTLFNGKVHDAMTCVTDQLTMRGYLSTVENKAITDLKGAMLRLFNEGIDPTVAARKVDLDILDDIASKELRESPSFFVTTKEINSPYDWVMITSSSFRDRDGQYVSQKAHEQDIARMDATGNYGTLDWWHLHPIAFEYLEKKEVVAQLPPYVQQHGIILGDCTFSAMYRRTRIEAGTYRSPTIKEAMDAHKDELSASLLYLRPRNEPDGDGIYHNIYTVTRAIMPRVKVSNLAPFLQGVF